MDKPTTDTNNDGEDSVLKLPTTTDLPHTLTSDEVINRLCVSHHGLTADEAARRGLISRSTSPDQKWSFNW